MQLPREGIFAECAPEVSDALSRIATEIRLERGGVLFEERDPGDALFAVLDGTLEISVLSPGGRKLTLDVLRSGAMLGEIALFDPGVRTATATALDRCQLLRIRNGDLLQQIEGDPKLAIAVYQLAGRRMRAMNRQLSDQVFLPMPVRLARKVLYLLDVTDKGDTLRMSQSDLADFMGTTREAVAKTIAEWKRLGMVDPGRGVLTVSDRDALDALAEAESE